MNIRTAERRDLSAMLDIYNYEVKNGTATFDVEPRAGAAGEAWFAAHNTGNHPLLVAEEDGKVLGYASLSPYRDFDAYLQTVELSVYVAPESRGRGIASALMEAVPPGGITFWDGFTAVQPHEAWTFWISSDSVPSLRIG